MKRKLKVAVLMGGKSAEREISLISGREVIKNLNPTKYETIPIVISKDGIRWQIGDQEKFHSDSPAVAIPKSKKNSIINTSQNNPQIIKNLNIDLIFIALHGSFGEDGIIQSFLELMSVPYTGSGVLASALGMNKIYSRKLFTQAGLKVPKTIVIRKADSLKEIYQKLDFPLFVKPNDQGSSVGISKVRNKKRLQSAIKAAQKFADVVLVEEYIDGIEVTVGILGTKALPVVEIVPKRDFFDYEAKYDSKLTDEIVPARIKKTLADKAQQAALDAFNALDCRAFGRVDMIIRGNDIYVLELNTIPGLTPVSLLPKAAQAAGISYPLLLDNIITLALN